MGASSAAQIVSKEAKRRKDPVTVMVTGSFFVSRG
jgi:hypothetical protein